MEKHQNFYISRNTPKFTEFLHLYIFIFKLPLGTIQGKRLKQKNKKNNRWNAAVEEEQLNLRKLNFVIPRENRGTATFFFRKNSWKQNSQ